MSASGGSAAAGGALVPTGGSGSRKKRRAATSVARVYADVNQQRPPAYWDYEKMDIEWRLATSAHGGAEKPSVADPFSMRPLARS